MACTRCGGFGAYYDSAIVSWKNCDCDGVKPCEACGDTSVDELRAWATDALRGSPFEKFVGPCIHGRDPYTRCDTCGELKPETARLLAGLRDACRGVVARWREERKRHVEARWRIRYLEDLPECRRQLPDGTVPGCTEDALRAWMHVADEAGLDRDRLQKENTEMRGMFDITRHRMAECLGRSPCDSWSSLESSAESIRAELHRVLNNRDAARSQVESQRRALAGVQSKIAHLQTRIEGHIARAEQLRSERDEARKNIAAASMELDGFQAADPYGDGDLALRIRDLHGRLTRERDDIETRRESAVKMLGRFGEALVNAGFPDGDRDVQLRNLTELIAERDCLRAAVERLTKEVTDARATCERLIHERDAAIDARNRETAQGAAAGLEVHQLRERVAKLARDRDEARAWQRAVVEGIGFWNSADGHMGGEVAAPDAIISEWRAMDSDLDEARAERDKARDALAASEVKKITARSERDAAVAKAAAMRGALGDLVTALACCSGPVSPSPKLADAVYKARDKALAALAPDVGAARVAALERVVKAAREYMCAWDPERMDALEGAIAELDRKGLGDA